MATNTPYNGDVAPNQTLDIGFNGSYTGGNARPASFAVNGVTCALA